MKRQTSIMEIKENESINQTALVLSEGKLGAIKFYGSSQDPLVEMSALLTVLTDVSREDLTANLMRDDYIIDHGKTYLKDSGLYAALYMTKLDIGQFFRIFIRKLIRNIWESNPALLIQTAEETKAELAQLRLRYRQQRNEFLQAQGRIREMEVSLDGQSRHTTKIISLMQKARKPEAVDRTEEFQSMCRMFLKPMYVYMKPPPKSAENEDDEDEDEDHTLYSEEVEPDADLITYYSVSSHNSRKSEGTLVKTLYGPSGMHSLIKEELEPYKSINLVYRCTLGLIVELAEKYRDAFIKEGKKTKPRKKKSSDDSDSD